MGWWKTEHGVVGDWPADILDAAIKRIEQVYLQESGRLPTQGELANLIEFCTCGCLRPACGDPAHPFSKASAHRDTTPRAAPRGDQGATGRGSTPPPGKIANVDPTTGDYYDRKDVPKVIADQEAEAERRREAGDNPGQMYGGTT